MKHGGMGVQLHAFIISALDWGERPTSPSQGMIRDGRWVGSVPWGWSERSEHCGEEINLLPLPGIGHPAASLVSLPTELFWFPDTNNECYWICNFTYRALNKPLEDKTTKEGDCKERGVSLHLFVESKYWHSMHTYNCHVFCKVEMYVNDFILRIHVKVQLSLCLTN
jgi:hypothetical protein